MCLTKVIQHLRILYINLALVQFSVVWLSAMYLVTLHTIAYIVHTYQPLHYRYLDLGLYYFSGYFSIFSGS